MGNRFKAALSRLSGSSDYYNCTNNLVLSNSRLRLRLGVKLTFRSPSTRVLRMYDMYDNMTSNVDFEFLARVLLMCTIGS